MTETDEKDWVLNEINQRGLVDMLSETSSQLGALFYKHQSTLLHRMFIDTDRGPINNPRVSFFNVMLTNAGRAFIANGGFKKEEQLINAEIADRLDIKLATVRTAKWQTIGVVASFVVGFATICITGVTAYFTYTADRQEKALQGKRLDRLEHLVDSMRINKSPRPPLSQSTKPVAFSTNSTTTVLSGEKNKLSLVRTLLPFLR